MDVVGVGAETGTGGEGKAAGNGEEQESIKRKEDDADSARKGIHEIFRPRDSQVYTMKHTATCTLLLAWS